MEDATETIEAILGILHACNVPQPGCDQHPSAEFVEEASHWSVVSICNFGCHPLCLAHEAFGLQVVDLCRCSFCGATGEPSVAASYVYSVYVSELEKASELGTMASWADLMKAMTPSCKVPLTEILRKLCQQDAKLQKI
eukprot:Skav211314  [mRNA]  locus=scaffold2139:5451:5983:- [translate_table: standard]